MCITFSETPETNIMIIKRRTGKIIIENAPTKYQIFVGAFFRLLSFL